AALHRVTVDHVPHLVTLIRRDPMMSLIRQRERRPRTLQRPRTRSHRLDPPGTLIRVDDLLADVDLMPLNTTLREQPRKQGHRRPGLILRRGSNLNPRRRVLHTHRLHPIPTSKPARPHKLERRHHRTKRVLPPTLQPLNNTIPENKPAPLINRIPPDKQAGLLTRQPEWGPVRTVKNLPKPKRRPLIPQQPPPPITTPPPQTPGPPGTRPPCPPTRGRYLTAKDSDGAPPHS